MQKRTLTKERHAVGAYWEYVLGLCEKLLLDLGNLKGKRGRLADHVPEGHVPVPGATEDPDPGECQRFRREWSRLFLGVGEGEPDDDKLLKFRYDLRYTLLHGGPKDLRVLAIQMANRAARTGRTDQAHPNFRWFDFTLRDGSTWNAPILFDFPRALAAALLSFSGKGHKLVCCLRCGRCAIGRSNQRFCPGGKCRFAWHRSQPAYKEKWRKYMKQKMRYYRALEKHRNQTNQKL